MEVLVTGGAGFLGSNLCEKLLQKGFSVTCLDNLSTGREENIAHLGGNPLFRFVKHDIRQPFDNNVKYDVIFNLACPASPPAYKKDPIFTTMTCTLGVYNMIELAKKYSSTLFHSSTSEVYGDPEIIPQKETYTGNVNPIGERSCYDEGKRCAESLLFDAKRQYGLNIKVVRIFNTYGPKMAVDDGRVVTNFIIQAINNEPITIYGDGSQTRCFCYVDDQLEGWFKLLSSEHSGPMNIGTTEEITILDFAKFVIHLTNSSSDILFQEATEDDPKRRVPDITLATQILDWRPQISLEEGLQRTIGYLQNLPS